jgi:very-short-patch-repair endonuclease
MGVSWRHVPGGIYDRGKSATNRAEADAVVVEIVRRLRDDRLRRWSIGVVTFSQAQQTLIENLLEEVRRTYPEVEGFFSEEASEPVFVKNLENVQGDERDVILFSICYGSDALGRVSLNFGPMNREGREWRLNVAITRARREVLVFSTLRADQIDLSRSRARGVRDLKNFLEYAERGTSAIAEATQYDPDADFESPFEKAVYDSLVDKGWEVHQQVGCARYRIDLAVVDPEARGRYLLGIECDGANYHRAKTARDRDKLRHGILCDLGWELHRIWSTDWWTNPEHEVRKLEAALEHVVRKWRDRPTAPQESGVHGEDATKIVTDLLPPASAKPVERPLSTPPETNLLVYTPYLVNRALGTQEEFYQPSSDRRIREVIADVVRHEGPVSLRLVARRVAAHWGFKQVREQALERVRRLLPGNEVRTHTSAAGVFLWPAGTNLDTYGDFRVSGASPESLRDAEDLPVEEVANAALFILRQHISAPEKELARETGRLFGFQRTSRRVEGRMRAGIALLIQTGAARRDETTIILQLS